MPDNLLPRRPAIHQLLEGRTDNLLIVAGLGSAIWDAELMMGLYALPTVAVRRPSNLSIVCIDNERFGETGRQVSHTAEGVNLAGIARASGFPHVLEVHNQTGVDALRTAVHRAEGPLFAVIKVSSDMPPVVMPIRDASIGKSRFREALLGERGLKE